MKDKSRKASKKFDLTIWNRPRVNSKILIKLAWFLPCGKAEYTAYPSLPRVCGSTLQLHPRTPWICSILDFCNVGVLRALDYKKIS